MACSICGVETKVEHDSLGLKHKWTETEGDLQTVGEASRLGKKKTIEDLQVEVETLADFVGELLVLLIESGAVPLEKTIKMVRELKS